MNQDHTLLPKTFAKNWRQLIIVNKTKMRRQNCVLGDETVHGNKLEKTKTKIIIIIIIDIHKY